jgi:hypothetical protein
LIPVFPKINDSNDTLEGIYAVTVHQSILSFNVELEKFNVFLATQLNKSSGRNFSGNSE